MKLLFKQRFFSWLDSYDIYDEAGNTVFTVEGRLDWGHRLHILNTYGEHVGTVKQVLFTIMPRFDLYVGENHVGNIRKEFTLFKPAFAMELNGWTVQGEFMEWDYTIYDSQGEIVATISKELWNLTDTYSIEVKREEDALYVLMAVLAIDAEKCSRD